MRPWRAARVDPAVPAMLVLTFSTGVADAVGYLALDKVFTGNMTGNVVILGMGAAGAQDLPVAGPLLALTAFLAGAAAGGRALRARPGEPLRRAPVLLAAIGAAFTGAAAWLTIGGVRIGTPAAYGITALMAAAMGTQAAVARGIAVKDVTTVVVTSTLTGLAADSWLGSGAGQQWRRRLAAVALIGLGALVGALLVGYRPWAGVALTALLTLGVAVAVEVANRRSP
jgi:uncharacterized membrane protein YoaK (UPF0700 family)